MRTVFFLWLSACGGAAVGVDSDGPDSDTDPGVLAGSWFTPPTVGGRVPDLIGFDGGGAPTRLLDTAGSVPLIVAVHGVWCTLCGEEMEWFADRPSTAFPHLDRRLKDAIAAGDVGVVSVLTHGAPGVPATAADVAAWELAHPLSGATYMADDGGALYAWANVQYLTWYLIVDEDGLILHHGGGVTAVEPYAASLP